VKIKTKNKVFVFLFIPLLAGFFVFEKCFAEENDLIITEILPNPSGSSEKKNEFIELYNPGNLIIDLTDWYFYGESKKFLLSGDIKSKEFKAFYNTLTLYNKKSTIQLFNPDLKLISEIIYSTPKKEDFSFSLICNNWIWVFPATPGEKNPDCEEEEIKEYSDKIYINEIFPAPKEKDDEYIELYNPLEIEIDLSGWTLKDASKSGKYEFPEKSKISPGAYLTVYKNKDFKFSLNNTSKEKVSLLDPNKKEISEVSYNSAKKEYSYSFDGDSWKWTSKPTPEEKNDFDEIISEKSIRIIGLSPNPKGKDTKNEWIEIQNKSKKKVNLKNWSIATGWKKLSNHPIRKDFEIKAGKTKKLTRKNCAFTLNNSKAKIELRDPDGKIIQEIKYKLKKNTTVEENAIYKKSDKNKWDWSSENTDDKKKIISEKNNPASLSSSEKNKLTSAKEKREDENTVNISLEEIQAGLGKLCEDSRWKIRKESRKKILLADLKIKIPAENFSTSFVLGSETSFRVTSAIKTYENYYFFTRFDFKKHWAIDLWEKELIKINSILNGVISKF
jgi:hypothetical protein